jgi:hypothetical protein
VDEAGRFKFYRIPKILIIDKRFAVVSDDAKILYGLLLDRVSLSKKNGWFDERGRVFIYFGLDEIQEKMNCQHKKAVKLMAELDRESGVGLLERKRQQGKPAMIFLKDFTSLDKTEQPRAGVSPPTSRGADMPTSRGVKMETSRGADLDTSRGADLDTSYYKNHTKKNYTDKNHPNLSIGKPKNGGGSAVENPSDVMDKMDEIDRYIKLFKSKISYDYLLDRLPYRADIIDEFVALAVDTITTTKQYVTVNGERKPAEVVRSALMKLNAGHIEYVLDSMDSNTTQVKNVRSYMLTMLYNSSMTVGTYYQNRVNHDLYGD